MQSFMITDIFFQSRWFGWQVDQVFCEFGRIGFGPKKINDDQYQNDEGKPLKELHTTGFHKTNIIPRLKGVKSLLIIHFTCSPRLISVPSPPGKVDKLTG